VPKWHTIKGVRKMSDWEKEPWRTSLRILLRHNLWREATKVVKEFSLENELGTLEGDEDETVRENVIFVSSNLESRNNYFPQIKDALNAPTPRVRIAATREIINIHPTQSRAPLLQLLGKEQHDGVIKSALESLKEVGELEDIKAIALFLDHGSNEIVNEARSAIVRIYNRSIQPTRIEKVQRFWRTRAKLDIFEIPIYVGLLLLVAYLGGLNLEEAAIMSLILTYFLGRLKALIKPEY